MTGVSSSPRRTYDGFWKYCRHTKKLLSSKREKGMVPVSKHAVAVGTMGVGGDAFAFLVMAFLLRIGEISVAE